ncbi:hypothetical protein B0H19DRAFT_1153482 [Mycena capillaripes]|nr:hypothetical protein B0H19DRAFT_1153482 [Mycena capillaripes]
MLFALAYGSFGDLIETAKLAVQIAAFLRNGRKLSQERLALATELKTLNSQLITLTFVASGVHIDPLCTHSLSVVACIRSEVESCHKVLVQFLNELHKPRGILGSIAQAINEESKLEKFRNELSRPLNTIRTLMLTLNLIASKGVSSQLNGAILQLEVLRYPVLSIGPQILAVGDKVDLYGDRLAAVHEAVLKLPIPRGISDDILFVVDPIGGNIPISLRYCHVYADVDRILKAHLINRPEAGARYIERGDYHIVSDDGATILPVEFARRVRAGMEVEMSIIQRKPRNPRWTNAQCPHCHHHNVDEAGNGWFKCGNTTCAKKYRIDLLAEEDMDKIEEIQEIVSPQISLTRGKPERQAKPEESFRLVHIYTTPSTRMPRPPRRIRKGNLPPLQIPAPPPPKPRHPVQDWATWQPDPYLPGSPGLFGPRSPRSHQVMDQSDSESDVPSPGFEERFNREFFFPRLYGSSRLY